MPQIILTLQGSADKIRALMSVDLSQTLDPLRLARSEEHLQGEIELSRMTRVRDLLQSDEGNVSFILAFDNDEAGNCRIRVEIETRLAMKCQRCLQPMQVDVVRQSVLGVVEDKTAIANLPNDYEPVILAENENMTVINIVEDELLLAIPISPLHAPADCGASKQLEQLSTEAKVNPFAALASLKTREK